MSETRSGIFTTREFSYRRNVLKIAPDAFITINDALSSRVLSPMRLDSTQDAELRGGVTSISVSCAVSPPGASRATFEVVAPTYKGLHEDYYITLPNGVKVPIFTPMMEVKIYMKCRFIEEEYNYSPRYYPVFWGMITGVQESFSGGSSTFSVTCEDLLTWWKHQKVNVQSSVVNAFYGGALMTRFPSAFENMSAWEIIVALFSDTFFTQVNEETGTQAFFNFLYPQWSNIALPPDIKQLRETWGPFAKNVIGYWNRRFGFGIENTGTPEQIAASYSNVPLEMMGLQGPIDFNVIVKRVMFTDYTKRRIESQTNRTANLDLDYGLLSLVQPYGMFDLYGDGAEAQTSSKLEIATNVCEKVNMEFFVDTNGNFVFKPPLYNLDVASGEVPYYKVGPADVINYTTNYDSNAIVNFLTVTGPLWQELPNLQAIGLHADFESIKRFGIRSDQISVPYGMNAKQLKMIAVAEMTRRNGQAFTASLSIPLRPEMRLGYPVYIEHLDTYYYVTGITHSLNFGSTAQTDLSLQFKRERVFDDGTSGLPDSQLWDVMRSCVLRDRGADLQDLSKLEELRQKMSPEVFSTYMKDKYDVTIADSQTNAATVNELSKENARRANNLFSGPGLLGYWKIDRAQLLTTADTIKYPQTKDAVISNELVMITDTSVPYTDKNGYRHIGAFPFGANLMLMKNGKMLDGTNYVQWLESQTQKQLNAKGSESQTNEATSTVQDTSTSTSSAGSPDIPNETREATFNRVFEQVKNRQKNADSGIINPNTAPTKFSDEFLKDYRTQGTAKTDATKTAVQIQLNSGSSMSTTKGAPQQGGAQQQQADRSLGVTR